MNVAVYGAGLSRFGRQPGVRATDLAWEAVTGALADAGVDPGADPGADPGVDPGADPGAAPVDAVYVGSVFGEMGVAQRVLAPLGLRRVPVVRVENACASGTTAFHEAAAAVGSGRYGRVLALGVEHLSRTVRGPLPLEPRDPEGATGLVLPALYAMAATRYQEVHGLTDKQLAQVAVKNRGNARFLPEALHGEELTVAEVLASRMVADPLTLLQCSPVSDGAAAVVLGPPRGNRRDVRVLASALASGDRWGPGRDAVWGFDIVSRAAATAYARAGLGPADLDVVECHDAFTIGEIISYEALGLAEVGAGGALVDSGATALGGRRPVNPSGGLLGRGHPVGATGVAQLVEIVTQLRGEAGDRQVAGARRGLVETMGGGVAGLDGNACVIVVLGR